MRQVKTHKLNGVQYYIDTDVLDGWSDKPKKPDKREYPSIHLPAGLPYGNDKRAKTGLITIVHEILHTENWDISESVVERVSKDMGSLLWRLGYRRIH